MSPTSNLAPGGENPKSTFVVTGGDGFLALICGEVEAMETNDNIPTPFNNRDMLLVMMFERWRRRHPEQGSSSYFILSWCGLCMRSLVGVSDSWVEQMDNTTLLD